MPFPFYLIWLSYFVFNIRLYAFCKRCIIKRNNDGYPIVRFSLFEKEKIVAGKTIIKSFNDIDLSKLDDDQIRELHRSSGKVNLELYNGQNLSLISKPYKLNDFKLSHFDIKSIHNIDTTKGILELSFEANFTNSRADFLEILKNDAIEDTGRHEICSEFKNKLPWPIVSIEFDEFKYDADVREGLKNKEKLVTSVFDLIAVLDKNNKIKEIRTFRIEKGVAFFRQSFDFKSFPFDRQKLIITIKAGEGSYMYENQQNRKEEGSVTFVTPEIGPYLNLIKFINPDINDVIISKKIGADCVELHMGRFCNLFNHKKKTKYEYLRIKKTALFAKKKSLEVGFK